MMWKRLIQAIRGGREEDPGKEPEEAEELPEAFEVTDLLDLHGFYPNQIPEVLDEFLANAGRLGLEEVRIIHGKGGSVLKREVWKVLENHSRVVSFRDAPPERGGWGATIAWLSKREKEE